MSSMERASSPKPLPKLGSGDTDFEERFSMVSPVATWKPQMDHASMLTPMCGNQKRHAATIDDGCSTVAPSPGCMTTPCPWDTPFQGLLSPWPSAGGGPSPKTSCRRGLLPFSPTAPPRADTSNPVLDLDAASSAFHADSPSAVMQLDNIYDIAAMMGLPPLLMDGAVALPEPSPKAASRSNSLQQPETDDCPHLETWAAAAQVAAKATCPFPMLPPPPQTPRTTPSQSTREHPATPGAPKKPAMPALMQALQSDSVYAVERVLKADPEAAFLPFWDFESEPPLCYAVRRLCDPHIVQLLLDAGAQVDALNCKGETSLAMLHSSDFVPDKLPTLPAFMQSEPLCKTEGEDRRMMIMELLTQAGGTSGLEEDSVSTPRTPCGGHGRPTTPGAPKKPSAPDMMHALSSDSVDAVRKVLAADPEAAWMPFLDFDSEQPLCYAVRRLCDPRIVQLLLDAGAQVDALNCKGETSLAMLQSSGFVPDKLPTLPAFMQSEPLCKTEGEDRRMMIMELLTQAGGTSRSEAGVL
eukprot:TRINITY_DN2501_c0_g1_i2.p1 TRINITY_DN2501_c0_g1~~TRINITY_DN2501_c0_g1_i2.p1  ORF type:complete len:525 (+),score=88.71 TRINITY_DN2501_c0_g1_i2:77-1651(+)